MRVRAPEGIAIARCVVALALLGLGALLESRGHLYADYVCMLLSVWLGYLNLRDGLRARREFKRLQSLRPLP